MPPHTRGGGGEWHSTTQSVGGARTPCHRRIGGAELAANAVKPGSSGVGGHAGTACPHLLAPRYYLLISQSAGCHFHQAAGCVPSSEPTGEHALRVAVTVRPP